MIRLSRTAVSGNRYLDHFKSYYLINLLWSDSVSNELTFKGIIMTDKNKLMESPAWQAIFPSVAVKTRATTPEEFAKIDWEEVAEDKIFSMKMYD